MSSLLFERDGSVATLVLNRPDSLNSMTNELMGGIIDTAAEVVSDESIRVVVITGAGRGFCSGADLSPPKNAADSGSGGTTAAHDMRGVFNPAIRSIAELPVPTIAKVNGVAGGGGFALALACDITIAARSAFFVATFGPRLGTLPDLGTTWHLPLRVGLARACGITMLGDRIPADQAKEWGLIWDVADDEQLDRAVDEVAARLARSSPDAMVRIRRSLQEAGHNSLAEQLDLELVHQRVLVPKNMPEGASAFMEKRQPHFDAGRTEDQ